MITSNFGTCGPLLLVTLFAVVLIVFGVLDFVIPPVRTFLRSMLLGPADCTFLFKILKAMSMSSQISQSPQILPHDH